LAPGFFGLTRVHFSGQNLSFSVNLVYPKYSMKIKPIALYSAFLALSSSSLLALSATINWGSAPAVGGGLFKGEDGASADSITLGYFSGVANAALTGWSAIQTDNSFNTEQGFNTANATSADVTAANGLDAWILIQDSSLSGLFRANDWVAYSGGDPAGDPPSPEPTIAFQLDAGDTAAGISFIQGVGTTLSIMDNGGQGGGSGVSIQLSAVPEPSAFALLSGALALGWVMVRRRA
jgi:hypothetical protein